MIGINKDNAQIDSRFVVSFSGVNGLNLFWYIINTGEWQQELFHFAEDVWFILDEINKGTNKSGDFLSRRDDLYRHFAPIAVGPKSVKELRRSRT
jgi:hypothetical protein